MVQKNTLHNFLFVNRVSTVLLRYIRLCVCSKKTKVDRSIGRFTFKEHNRHTYDLSRLIQWSSKEKFSVQRKKSMESEKTSLAWKITKVIKKYDKYERCKWIVLCSLITPNNIIFQKQKRGAVGLGSVRRPKSLFSLGLFFISNVPKAQSLATSTLLCFTCGSYVLFPPDCYFYMVVKNISFCTTDSIYYCLVVF